MKDWVKEKLNKIDELFPPERIARSKERLRRVWKGEKPLDRYPFTYSPGLLDYYCAPPTPDSYEQHLRISLDDIILRGKFDDDFIPGFTSGCNASVMPSLFGAEEVIRGNDHACERILQKPEDIDSLPDPGIKPGTSAHNVLTLQEYLLEETQGRMPVHVVDMQGPGDCCGKMWGYDKLFLCAYEDPERYDKLMSKVTEGFVMLWKRQMKLLGGLLIKTHIHTWDWVPDDVGVTCSVDSLVMLSPDFYDNFYKPYIARIGETFGGVTVHSCGKFPAVVRNVSRTPYMRGINASEMTIIELINAGMREDIVASGELPIYAVEEIFDFVRKHSLRIQISLKGIWPVNDRGVKPVKEWDETDMKMMKDFEQKALHAVRS